MMKLTVTIKVGNGGDEAPSVGPTIDGDAVEVFPAPPKLALPRPRPWWRSKKPTLLDGAVFAGTVAGITWWLW